VTFFLGNDVITWSSQKQKTVALSSCEAEYIAAAAAAVQGVWLSRLLGELTGLPPAKFSLQIDNKSAIACVKKKSAIAFVTIRFITIETSTLTPSSTTSENASRLDAWRLIMLALKGS
jgi:hypothetical protein